MSKFMMIPRAIYFKDGKALASSFDHGEHDESCVIFLPTDHYDFRGPVKVAGRTKEEITSEADTYR